jgi:hypothetical protein
MLRRGPKKMLMYLLCCVPKHVLICLLRCVSKHVLMYVLRCVPEHGVMYSLRCVHKSVGSVNKSEVMYLLRRGQTMC